MPYDIHYSEKDGVIVVNNAGKLTYDELKKETQETITLGNDKNTNLYLINFTNVNVQAKIIDIYQFPKLYEQMGMSSQSKIAVVVSEIELKTEELNFYDNVCYNRGWKIKIFLQKDHALKWLTNNK